MGIETLLVRAGDGPVLQIPLTYRGAPLAGAEAWLITTMTHSVLGERWVYDATGDPVYLAAVARAALTGGHEAEQFHDVDGVKVLRPSTATVSGSGEPGASVVTMPHIEAVSTEQATESTVVETDALRLVVMRLPGAEGGAAPEATAVLTGTWAASRSRTFWSRSLCADAVRFGWCRARRTVRAAVDPGRLQRA